MSAFGTIVFTANLDFLCGPNLHVANNYIFVGKESKKDLCRHNMNVCFTINSPDLVHLWKVAELLCDEEGNGFGAPSEGLFPRDNSLAVLENILQALVERKDMQTLATLLCVCLGATCLNTKSSKEAKPRESSFFSPDFLTSSPALASVNAHLKATLNVVPHQATTFSAAPSLSSSAKAAAKDDDLLEIVVQP